MDVPVNDMLQTQLVRHFPEEQKAPPAGVRVGGWERGGGAGDLLGTGRCDRGQSQIQVGSSPFVGR